MLKVIFIFFLNILLDNAEENDIFEYLYVNLHFDDKKSIKAHYKQRRVNCT